MIFQNYELSCLFFEQPSKYEDKQLPAFEILKLMTNDSDV